MENPVKRKNKQNNTDDDMVNALNDVLKNDIIVYKASQKFKIPKTTLLNHLNGCA